MLAPSTMLSDQYRALIFASMRFTATGPVDEAKLLRSKLASHGVHLYINNTKPGESIDDAVFNTMARCDAFLAMATRDYGADTGNTASTHHEVRTWREEYESKGKPLIPLRMVSARARAFNFVGVLTRNMLLRRSRGAMSLSTRRGASCSGRTC